MAPDTTILAIDIGTTHCKAGVFALDGTALKIATRPMVTHRAPSGETYFDPEALWGTASAVIRKVTAAAGPIASIGIASMAETGLLLDRRTGAARSFFVPWFDTAAQAQADLIRRQSDPLERYLRTGLRASFKCSLAKVLWLRARDERLLEDAIWLSAADYIAYRLTGKFGTDCSLAGYTFAFRVDQRAWDTDWLREWRLDPDLFPPANPSGTSVGGVLSEVADSLGLPAGIPVAICGHDHATAAFAMNVTSPGKVFDSMGTAEILLGALPERPLTEDDFHSGLIYGCHVASGCGYWLGSLSASGGSVEWLRSQLGHQRLTYDEIDVLLASAGPHPTGILYFPYLVGSGPPHTDPLIRGALIGLSASHGRADLLKAVLEGTVYEVEFIRQTGEHITGQPIPALVTAGGGTRNRAWLQIKADVSGCRIEASAEPEATLLGAALVAGIGSGLYASEAEAFNGLALKPVEVFLPDPERHTVYRRLYEQGYLPLQEALSHHFNGKEKEHAEYE
ncbi:MAG TPA: FGGY family carbohydrate kinase [Anaerolineales bacterium]|nr:FGGY family carbohydrate kinase [Anaerolineales bacterium]